MRRLEARLSLRERSARIHSGHRSESKLRFIIPRMKISKNSTVFSLSLLSNELVLLG
jgi:hypothetical protein